jgi:hypothetical protein
MGAHLTARRRLILSKGRPMTLRRPNPGAAPAEPDVTLTGCLYPYAPEKIAGPLRQGDAQVQILHDEIAAVGWTDNPGTGDWLVIDGLTWLVQGEGPVYEGPTLIGHSLTVRGGQP